MRESEGENQINLPLPLLEDSETSHRGCYRTIFLYLLMQFLERSGYRRDRREEVCGSEFNKEILEGLHQEMSV